MPIPFALDIAGDQIEPDRRYALHAELSPSTRSCAGDGDAVPCSRRGRERGRDRGAARGRRRLARRPRVFAYDCDGAPSARGRGRAGARVPARSHCGARAVPSAGARRLGRNVTFWSQGEEASLEGTARARGLSRPAAAGAVNERPRARRARQALAWLCAGTVVSSPRATCSCPRSATSRCGSSSRWRGSRRRVTRRATGALRDRRVGLLAREAGDLVRCSGVRILLALSHMIGSEVSPNGKAGRWGLPPGGGHFADRVLLLWIRRRDDSPILRGRGGRDTPPAEVGEGSGRKHHQLEDDGEARPAGRECGAHSAAPGSGRGREPQP